jgi:hypothetical protein
MWSSIECAGHPRDMGLAQGGAFADSIRAACGAAGLSVRRSRAVSLAPLASGPVRGAGAGREFHRHFAHQAERLEGLARAAKVPADSVLELHLRIREGGAVGGLLSRRACLRAHTSGDSDPEKRIILERTLPIAAPDESGWMLRESRPAVGFRSVEVGLPWLVPGVAGVNEAGLSVMGGPILWGTPGRGGFPSSVLLVQECLQRFEDLEGALDWCRKRPVEGEQSVVLADASGSVATVISTGRTRRIQEGEGELYLEGGELATPAPHTSDMAEATHGTVSEAPPAQVILDPRRRSLRLETDGAAVETVIV